MFYKSFGRWRFPKTRIGRQMFHTTNISKLFCTCETFEVSDAKTCVKHQRHLSKCKHFHQEAEMNVHCSRTRQEIFRAKHFSKTQKHAREMSSTLISSDIKLCANVSSLLSLLSKGLDALCNRSPLQKDIRAGSKTYLLLSIPRYLRLETLVHEHQQGLLLTKTKMVLLEISGNVAASSL